MPSRLASTSSRARSVHGRGLLQRCIPWRLLPVNSYTLQHHPPSSPPATPTADDDVEDDAGAILSSPASHRLVSKRLYMWRKHAEASGGIAQLDLARLKPGRKVSAMSKFRQLKPRGDGHGASGGENPNPNPKQPVRGDTRPYKIRRELERLGIGGSRV
jgi:hypothetical protein